MLIRLLPEQVSNNWSEIKLAVEASLPPIVGMRSDRSNNILQAILFEKIIVWMSIKEDKIIDGIVLTSFIQDEVSGTKSLLIYCVYGYNATSMSSWSEGLETIKKFAVASKCSRVVGYSDVPSIIKFVESIGGETKYRLLSIPLGD